MHRNLLLFLLTSFVTLNAQQTKKVLFLGNSYTSYNQLPVLVANLANAGGHLIIQDSNTPGGTTFASHSNNATTLAKIKAQDWDYVVLQAQSQEPSFSPGQVATYTYPYAAILSDSILSNNPCTEPLFYMTWGRKNGDASNCGSYPPICTYDGMQQRLRESYVEMAQDNDASVAPVGVAWKTIRDLYPLIELYNPDQSHPSLEGSYLAACVFYASIFRESVLGNTYTAGLDSLTVYRLQDMASSTVLDSLSLWQIGVNDLNVNLPADTSFCGDSLIVTAQNVKGNLLWSTNEISNTLIIYNSGLVSAIVTNDRTCSLSDSVNVNLSSGVATNVFYEACDSFELDGIVYFEDTILSATFVLGNGCDSIVISEININQAPIIAFNFIEIPGNTDILYLESNDFDSTYIYEILWSVSVSNEDTMSYVCQFRGYALAWNTCGMDSAYLITGCLSIKELNNSWSIGPNPVKNSILISNTNQEGFSLNIIDLLGRVVYQEAYQNESFREVNLEDLTPNIYHLVLYDKQGIALGKKIIQKQ